MAIKYVRHDADGSGDGTTTANTGSSGAWTLAQMLSATPAAGDEIRVMATGTYSRSTTGTIAYANGTAAANILVTGANSSGTVDGTRPTVQASAGSITLLNVTGSNVTLRYLLVDGNSQSSVSGIVLAVNYTRAIQCVATRTTARGIYLNSSNCVLADRCEAYSCSGTAGIVATANGLVRFCYSHDNTCHGFQIEVSAIAEFCIADSNSGGSSDGFNCSSVGYRVTNCIAYNSGRDGFNLDGNAGFGTYLANCLSYGNASEGYGTDGVKSGAFLLNCAGGGNTGGNYNGTNLPNIEGFVSLSGNPFNDAANGDFSLDNTSGEGAACRAAGFPGVMPGGLSTGYLDIGALQHADSGGGGSGGTVVLPGRGFAYNGMAVH